MKIDDSVKKTTGLNVGTAQPRAGKGADKAGAAGAPATPAQSDSVHLSSKLQSIADTGSNAVFDAKKVEEIKAAIAEGRFQVDAEKVAVGLLDTVTNLIQTRKG